MKILNLIVILLLVIGCQTVKKATDISPLDKAIAQHFDANVDTVTNTSGTFILILQTQEPTMQVPVNALKFGIYDIKKEAIVYTEQKYNARASWYNDEYISIKSRPGVKSTDDAINSAMEHCYINVKTLVKLTKLPN
ncbi:hypothetical protein J1N10_17665 [Carboxylicivirga sp. A043]|uniref:hypothetical protein n=1 Tax=Carboxylicivirga litoralis TaxID=2816963 RepID=UPI0021CB3B39|nr:hypothetical protein [Carboxylicivirga sp. A043]MCU4157808.1 hypothetical protein [Carboxylicivirga sp. A043]